MNQKSDNCTFLTFCPLSLFVRAQWRCLVILLEFYALQAWYHSSKAWHGLPWSNTWTWLADSPSLVIVKLMFLASIDVHLYMRGILISWSVSSLGQKSTIKLWFGDWPKAHNGLKYGWAWFHGSSMKPENRIGGKLSGFIVYRVGFRF